MSPWLAVAVASVLVLRLAGVALPNELRRFSEFQYCDLEDRLNAAWLHSLQNLSPIGGATVFPFCVCAGALSISGLHGPVYLGNSSGRHPPGRIALDMADSLWAFPCPCCHWCVSRPGHTAFSFDMPLWHGHPFGEPVPEDKFPASPVLCVFAFASLRGCRLIVCLTL